ncbi:excalibur calcium-binding domain-containing protein [uncultured Ferrimonas sp.]|uniref:excalibur calcium-binding domain-containing protein n=1 Tax=uncultured Ferrimonas sp. TaxID=432640 RepID=UPI002623F8E7|nr:excalibur calcium-binding domain-containing protein [uncultured Ferrimonas sp.]
MERGQLVKWNDDKGYGFIKGEQSGLTVFIHISALRHMSRAPRQGDYVHYEAERQSDGKYRANKARLEGVKSTLKKQSHVYKPVSNLLPNMAVGLLILIIATVVYPYLFNRDPSPAPVIDNEYLAPAPSRSKTLPVFRCDGRQHCSQMNSRAEAEFFIRHCPNTKMDGDNDGVPCERDSRF